MAGVFGGHDGNLRVQRKGKIGKEVVVRSMDGMVVRIKVVKIKVEVKSECERKERHDVISQNPTVPTVPRLVIQSNRRMSPFTDDDCGLVDLIRTTVLHISSYSSGIYGILLRTITRTPLHDRFLTQPAFRRHSSHLARLNERPAILAPLLDIHKPNHDHRSSAYCKEKWEPHPVIPRGVDNRLDDIRADDGGLVGVSIWRGAN